MVTNTKKGGKGENVPRGGGWGKGLSYINSQSHRSPIVRPDIIKRGEKNFSSGFVVSKGKEREKQKRRGKENEIFPLLHKNLKKLAGVMGRFTGNSIKVDGISERQPRKRRGGQKKPWSCWDINF